MFSKQHPFPTVLFVGCSFNPRQGLLALMLLQFSCQLLGCRKCTYTLSFLVRVSTQNNKGLDACSTLLPYQLFLGCPAPNSSAAPTVRRPSGPEQTQLPVKAQHIVHSHSSLPLCGAVQTKKGALFASRQQASTKESRETDLLIILLRLLLFLHLFILLRLLLFLHLFILLRSLLF